MTVLIGSGMLRNILFGLISLSTGFFLALSLALLVAERVVPDRPGAGDDLHLPRHTSADPVLHRLSDLCQLRSGRVPHGAYGASVVLFFNTAC